MDCMTRFDKSKRLLKKQDYDKVFAHSTKAVSRHFIIFARFDNDSLKKQSEDANAKSFDRLGIIASKKVGNAVARNRAKRLIRECFRHSPFAKLDELYSAKNAQPGHTTDYVVIARKACLEDAFLDLRQSFDRSMGYLTRVRSKNSMQSQAK